MLLFCAQLSPELYLGIVCECACLKNRGTLKCRLTAELARSFHSCQLVRYGGPISKVVFPGFAVAATVHAKLLPECFRARQLPAGTTVCHRSAKSMFYFPPSRTVGAQFGALLNHLAFNSIDLKHNNIQL